MPTLDPARGPGALPPGARLVRGPGPALARTGVNPAWPTEEEDEHASQEGERGLPVWDEGQVVPGQGSEGQGGTAGASDPSRQAPEEVVPNRRHRYLLNTRTGVLHDTDGLTEECNTDDISPKYRFSTQDEDEARQHLAFRRKCRMCTPRAAALHRITTVPNPFGNARPST